ncbi:MAG: hypothetical protein HQL20_00080 [Candidatus Omnitrophica bacterium]|nr:hypothetical protein [Candidatus Omnitrophota bacterium]
MNVNHYKGTVVYRSICSLLILSFIFSAVVPPRSGWAQTVLNLPAPGTMVMASPAFMPVLIKGLKVHPENPLLFDFILDTGSTKLATNEKPGLDVNGPEFKAETQKLIKYFLASLTIKEDDLWVNLSPFERDRMIAADLGQTELGRDMLAQDYMLKQLTASMIYPEKELGQAFWAKVYAQAQEQFGTTDVPVDTFNKVWIVADKAQVMEHNNAAYVVGSHLKVMLETDYLATSTSAMPTRGHDAPPADTNERGFVSPRRLPTSQPTNVKATQVSTPTPNPTKVPNDINDTNNTNATTPENNIAKNILREIVLPMIEKEVNEGQNFAPLRQMFFSMIMASWYKQALKGALLNQVYTNKAKTGGVQVDDQSAKEKIYEQYLQAYKKGVFNYIKEDAGLALNPGADPEAQQSIPRKYFSGGLIVMKNFAGKGPTIVPFDGAAVVRDFSAAVNVRARMDQSQSIDRETLESVQISLNELMGKPVTRDVLQNELTSKARLSGVSVDDGIIKGVKAGTIVVRESGIEYGFTQDELNKLAGNPNQMTFTVMLLSKGKLASFLVVIPRGTAVDIATIALDEAFKKYDNARMSLEQIQSGGRGYTEEQQKPGRKKDQDLQDERDKMAEGLAEMIPRVKVVLSLGGSVAWNIRDIVGEKVKPYLSCFVTFTRKDGRVYDITVNGEKVVVPISRHLHPYWGNLVAMHPDLRPLEHVKLSVALAGYAVTEHDINDITTDESQKSLIDAGYNKLTEGQSLRFALKPGTMGIMLDIERSGKTRRERVYLSVNNHYQLIVASELIGGVRQVTLDAYGFVDLDALLESDVSVEIQWNNGEIVVHSSRRSADPLLVKRSVFFPDNNSGEQEVIVSSSSGKSERTIINDDFREGKGNEYQVNGAKVLLVSSGSNPDKRHVVVSAFADVKPGSGQEFTVQLVDPSMQTWESLALEIRAQFLAALKSDLERALPGDITNIGLRGRYDYEGYGIAFPAIAKLIQEGTVAADSLFNAITEYIVKQHPVEGEQSIRIRWPAKDEGKSGIRQWERGISMLEGGNLSPRVWTGTSGSDGQVAMLWENIADDAPLQYVKDWLAKESAKQPTAATAGVEVSPVGKAAFSGSNAQPLVFQEYQDMFRAYSNSDGIRRKWLRITTKNNEVVRVQVIGMNDNWIFGLDDKRERVYITRNDFKSATSDPSANQAFSPGGIELNAKRMGLEVAKDGKGVNMTIDPAMVADFERGDFSGVVPVILQIVPIRNPLVTLGLGGDAPAEKLIQGKA